MIIIIIVRDMLSGVYFGGRRDAPSAPEQLKSVICSMPEKHKATAYSCMIMPLTPLGQIVKSHGLPLSKLPPINCLWLVRMIHFSIERMREDA